MKKLGFIAMVLLAGCLLAAPLASARAQSTGQTKAGAAQEQVKALQAKAIEALLEAHTSFFQEYFADDIVIIHGTGAAVTKAQDIDNLRSGALKYVSYDVHERKIRTYGNTAVVNDLASAKGLINSQPFSGDFRITWVWVELRGSWQCVSRQITKVPPS